MTEHECVAECLRHAEQRVTAGRWAVEEVSVEILADRQVRVELTRTGWQGRQQQRAGRTLAPQDVDPEAVPAALDALYRELDELVHDLPYEPTEEVRYAPPSIAPRVLAYIAAHPGAKAREIARRLDVGREAVSKALHRLRTAGRIVRAGPKCYARWTVAP
jgi:hypothetical protein